MTKLTNEAFLRPCSRGTFAYFAVMLAWFVDGNIAAAALQNPKTLIDESDIEVQQENISNAVLDDNVDLHIIRKFFTDDAWLLLTDVVKQKRKHHSYVCQVCFHNLDEEASILCDHCLLWSHMSCVGLKERPKSKWWFCRSCHKTSK